MGVGFALRFLPTDIGLIAGRAALVHGFAGYIPGRCNQRNFIDAHGRQRLKGQLRRLADHLLDQRGLAQGNLVLAGQFCQGIVAGSDGLGQDRRVQAAFQRVRNRLGHLLLQHRPVIRILVLHGNQDGILQITQVSLLQHGADNGIDRHLQGGALQLHAPQNLLRVRVQRLRGYNPFFRVHMQRQAGIHVHGNHRAGLGRLSSQEKAVYAKAQDKNRCHGGNGRHAGSSGFVTLTI